MRDLIKVKHEEAENTLFMKTVFERKMTEKLWADFTYNKSVWYKVIETKAEEEGLLEDLNGIERTEKLLDDFESFNKYENTPKVKNSVSEYSDYIMKLEPGKVVAHLYVWYMGDLSGGKMIKQIIKASNSSLEFDNSEELKKNLLSKINNDHIDEVNVAFDWAIKIMKEYDEEIINGN
ncbi:COG5398 Heme oxygenase [uncultured Caudovirales phage]|uniref:COG5398 Heme oxygenase n=1 Tax=uncultured Caudovirales phage TaxID=2100421 RepID=A0A6J5NYP1_9CAUD|nr:COG5398 Heme oxygenase [uncultured Caudovirales phage]